MDHRTSEGSSAASGHPAVPMPLPYIYRWDRQGRKDQTCSVIARGKMNSCLVQFADGYRMVTSRNAIRRNRTLGEKGKACA
jgi:hypothetical protein